MYRFPSLSFDLSNKYDFLKKSNLKNAQKILTLNKNNLYILNLSKNNLNRYSKISGFWSLEIMTLQKAFHTSYSSNVILYKSNINTFLYNFMKEGLASKFAELEEISKNYDQTQGSVAQHISEIFASFFG